MDWCGCSGYPSLRSLRTLWIFGPAGTASTHVNMEDDDLLGDTSWWDGVQADADAAEAAAAAAGAARS